MGAGETQKRYEVWMSFVRVCVESVYSQAVRVVICYSPLWGSLGTIISNIM